MITHIVQWRIRDGLGALDKPALLRKLQSELQSLTGKIPEIRAFEVGINEKAGEAAADLALFSTFDDWEALQRYQVHPAHLRVAEQVKAAATERRVTDFAGAFPA